MPDTEIDGLAASLSQSGTPAPSDGRYDLARERLDRSGAYRIAAVLDT
jgi:hypothetical protein